MQIVDLQDAIRIRMNNIIEKELICGKNMLFTKNYQVIKHNVAVQNHKQVINKTNEIDYDVDMPILFVYNQFLVILLEQIFITPLRILWCYILFLVLIIEVMK